jgi:hypothetical protein
VSTEHLDPEDARRLNLLLERFRATLAHATTAKGG